MRSTRKRKTAKQLLEIEADRIVKKIIMKRDAGLCCCPEPKSGHSRVMQSGHLISRSNKSVRWDLWNCNIQCSSCNLLHEHRPERYTKWFIKEFGADTWMKLVERSGVVRKIPEIEMRQICAGLNSIYVSLELWPKDEPLDMSQFRLTQEEIIRIGRIVVPDA